MVKFERYPHVNDLINHYISALNRPDIKDIIDNGILNNSQAEIFSRFIWNMVEAINEDEENNIIVMGSTDNTEMLPDVSYEITKLMRDCGFYSIWETVSKDEMQ